MSNDCQRSSLQVRPLGCFFPLSASQSLDAELLVRHSLLITNYSLLFLSFFLTTAGTPATSVSGGTSSVTTEPAAVTEPLPTLTGATSIVSEPILTLSSIIV